MSLDSRLVEPPYALQAHLGFRLTDWSEGYARFEMPIAPFLGNRYGIPHGGVYATLIDTAMGFCGCYTGDPEVRQLAMTLSLTVNYLSQPKGKLLIGEGKVTGGGARTYFAEATIIDETGEVIATGVGTFRRRGA